MPKGLVRKLDLERAISKIASHPSPNAYFEQYTISPAVAAETLLIAANIYNDILNKNILDLGCGTGRLAIGSILSGAKEAVGIDIDKVAVDLAKKNSEKMSVGENTHWIVGDIDVIRGSFDTVLQNPPFGVQRRRADRQFLKKSIELGLRIYSLHKSGKRNREFIKRLVKHHGGRIKAVYSMLMAIPHMFNFHRKHKHEFIIDLYVIEGKECEIKAE